MKFIVDELPKDKYDCYYSEWISAPPIIKEDGYYFCNLVNKDCNLQYDNTECEGLKIHE
jgi:hypothetical protein